jgi:hypothetical protein
MALIAIATGRPLAAQIDYRNLDEGRPVRTEDAYPVERHAFELVVPYEYENEVGSGRVHVVAPELAYGIAPNMMAGLKLPLAALDGGGPAGTDWGFGGPRLFAFYNFNTEGPALPAFALRADLSLPIGDLAGDAARVGVTAVATRSWGRTRAHLNGTVGLGSGDGASASAIHGVPRWAASLAVDRTFLRRSLLIVAEVAARESAAGAPTELSMAVGARMQLTPTFVLDAGVERRLTDRAGADLGLTLGLTHAFAIAALLPGHAR